MANPALPPRADDRASADDRRLTFHLLGLAALLLVVYLAFGFLVQQTAGRLGRPSAALIPELALWRWVSGLGLPVPKSGVGVAALVVGLAGTALGVYAWALRTVWKRASTVGLRVAMGVAIAFATVSIVYFPNLSSDIFNYMMRGRLAIVYGQSPYYVAVDQFPDDPMYPYTSPEYRHIAGEKLPAWMAVNMAFAGLAGDDPVRALFTYRAGFLLFHLLNLVLLADLLRRARPELRLAGVIAYGWSPIVALHALNKTDTLMIFLLLMAVWLWAVDRRRVAVIPLTLSAFVKLITLPLLATWFLQHVRTRRWRSLFTDAALALGTVVLIYLPFARDGWLVLDHLGLTKMVAAANLAPAPAPGSAPAGVQAMVEKRLEVSSRVVPHLGKASILCMLAIVGWAGFAPEVSWAGQVRRWAIITLLLVLLFSKLEFSWYWLTPLALATLAGSGALMSIVALVCASSFVFNVWQSAAAGDFELPHLLVNVPRAAVHLGVAAAGALLVLAFALASRRIRRPWRARVGHGQASP